MLSVVIVCVASAFQVARNAAQRGLVGDAGPWGATLVRFLFGLPFSLAIFGVIAMATAGAAPHLSARYVIGVSLGAVAQVAATAALLVAMRRSGFAVATMMQQASLPFSAVVGWLVLRDHIPAQAWAGIATTTAGLTVLSAPGREQGAGAALGPVLGLACGLAFAVALNAYRQAGLALEPHHPVYAGTAS